MSLAAFLGIKEAPKPKIEEEPKQKAISPFDFANSIFQTKQNLIVDEWSEKQYNPFMVNRVLSMGLDTVLAANELNLRSEMPKKAQYEFLLEFVRPRKRYNKWVKAEKNEDLDIVKKYFNYSGPKARAALRLLTSEDLDYIRDQLYTGGVSKGA